jgi:hypothetical protein
LTQAGFIADQLITEITIRARARFPVFYRIEGTIWAKSRKTAQCLRTPVGMRPWQLPRKWRFWTSFHKEVSGTGCRSILSDKAVLLPRCERSRSRAFVRGFWPVAVPPVLPALPFRSESRRPQVDGADEEGEIVAGRTSPVENRLYSLCGRVYFRWNPSGKSAGGPETRGSHAFTKHPVAFATPGIPRTTCPTSSIRLSAWSAWAVRTQ